MRFFLLILLLSSLGFSVYDPLQDNLELNRYDQLYSLAKQEVFTTENARGYYYLGQAYVGLGRKTLAENAFAQVFQYSYAADYGLAIAQYYEGLKNDQKAAETYARVLKDYPTENIAAQRLGELYFKQNKYQQTIDVCSHLVDEDPDKANPLAYYIGTSYFILGDLQKAQDYLERAQAKGYPNPDLTVKLGYIKIKSGDTKAGVELLAKGIGATTAPQPTYFYTTLGEAYARLNQFDLAASAYKKAISSAEQPVQVYINFASNATQVRNFQSIVDVLEPKVDHFATNGEYLYYLGNACDNLGIKDQAATYYQRSLDAGYPNKAFIKGRINALSNTGTPAEEE